MIYVYLLKFTEDPNASTSNGWTPLMIGIQEEHAQIVKYLSKFTNKANVTLIRNTFSKLSSYTESFIVHFILTKLLPTRYFYYYIMFKQVNNTKSNSI